MKSEASHDLGRTAEASKKKKKPATNGGRWSFLVEAAKALNSTLEIQQLLTRIVELSSQAVEAEATSLVIIDEKQGDLRYEIALGEIGEEVKKLRILSGQGIVGWVAREGKPAMVNDVATDSRFSGFIDSVTGFKSRSILCVPLLRKDIVRGVLVARNKKNGAGFTQEDLEIFSALADQVVLALDNSQLYQQARREIRKRMVLCEVGKLITSSLDLKKVLSLIMDALSHVVRYDAAGIFLLDSQAQHIEEEILRGYEIDLCCTARLKVGEGVSGWVVKTGQAIIVPDVSQEPHYINARSQTNSELAAPLKSGERVIGVFNLESDQLNAYDEHDLDLLTAFASQAAVAIENARLFQETLEMHRLEHELAVARDIQKSFLPQESPRLKGYDLAGMNIPSQEVGGDYFDFIPISEGQVGLVVADVSGKGIPAALIMAAFRAGLRAAIRDNYAIKEIFSKVNVLLQESTDTEQFVTAFYGVLDAKGRIFTFVNAGHNPPFVLSADGSLRRLETGGLPLGIRQTAGYQEEPIRLQSGDCLIFYTDGVTEAQNELKEEFGEERLVQVLRQSNHLSAEGLQKEIYDQIRKFAGQSGLGDDVTIVALKVLQ
jgi:sigma-B regulation protein RsbU (phosphoserine phosphatase)